MENNHTTVLPNESNPSEEVGFFDVVQLITNNLRLLLIGPLVAGVIALAITFLITPSFTATVRLMAPSQQSQGAALAMLQSLGTLGAVAAGASGLKNPNDLYVGLLNSRSVRDGIIDKFKLMERYDIKYKNLTREALAKKTNVNVSKDSTIIISFEDYEPSFAAQVANGYAQELGTLLSRLAISEAQMRSKFFETQLRKTKTNLDKAEIALKASGGVSLSALKLNPEYAIGATAQIKGQMTSLEIKLVSMRGYMSETAPEYAQAVTELTALKGHLAKIEKEEATTSGAGSDYLDKFRDFKYHETVYELLIRQYDMAKLDEGREGNVMQIVDSAEIPELKSSPKKAQIAVITTLVTGFLLFLFIFIQHYLKEAGSTPANSKKISSIKNSFKNTFLFK